MAKGLDTAQDCTTRIDCLKQAGFEFVGRYYNVNNRAKNLTRAEAKAMSDAALFIVSIWENGFPTTPAYFAYSKGVHDGTVAYHMAQLEIGQPATTPIYFAVDYDASELDIQNPIAEYFRGIRAGFATISQGAPLYEIGVYSSGCVCAWLRSQGLVSYVWLSQSTGWCGYEAFTGWNLKQGPELIVCGLDADLDESSGHGGGWKIPA